MSKKCDVVQTFESETENTGIQSNNRMTKQYDSVQNEVW
jgi:hypothetical protein